MAQNVLIHQPQSYEKNLNCKHFFTIFFNFMLKNSQKVSKEAKKRAITITKSLANKHFNRIEETIYWTCFHQTDVKLDFKIKNWKEKFDFILKKKQKEKYIRLFLRLLKII